MKTLNTNQINQVQGGLLLESAALVIGGTGLGFATGLGIISLSGMGGCATLGSVVIDAAFAEMTIIASTVTGAALGIGAAATKIVNHNYNNTHC